MTKGFNAGRFKVFFAFLLLFGPAFLLIFISTRGCEHKFKELEDYGEAPSYSFTTSTGKTVTSDGLKDKVVLMHMIEPSCPDSCSVSLWHIDQMIYQKLRKNKKEKGKIRIVSVVTDFEGDPTEGISSVETYLKDKIESYDPEIWMIVQGDIKSVYAHKYKDNTDLLGKGEKLIGGETFTERMILLDKKNHLRMVRSGKIEAYVRETYGHIALLLKQYDKQAFNKRKGNEK
jgi:cytochrome oxidase Cu insertion factor (SCO1/SenC/PrrC family)